MSDSSRLPQSCLVFVSLLALVGLPLAPAASAGTISLAWDPVSHPDLAGYRVYHGGATGNYTATVDTGLTTQLTLSGLADCTDHHVMVLAFTTDGTESPSPSNEVSGWARPIVASASPGQVERSSQVDLVIGGANFRPGATVGTSDPAIAVGAVSVNGCNQLTVSLAIGSAASVGPVDVEVINPGGVFGTGSGLIHVVADATPPSISDVSATAGTTTATVSWTTDEPADSQVFYRRQGETAYVASPIDATEVTDHALTLNGLDPLTTHEYYVRSADGAGNNSASPQGTAFTTLDSPYVYLRLEAESGALVAPVQASPGAGAFRGAWIDTPQGTQSGTAGSPAGTASYGFHVPYSASWRVWIRMYGLNGNSNSWFEEVDGAGLQEVQTGQNGVWQWIEARSYVLGEGLHTLRLGGREARARADRILITDDPGFVPSEQPGSDVTPPPPVGSLAATAGDARVDLSWRHPSGTDAATIVVRYRTDGSFPQSPLDGLPLFEEPAVPGSSGATSHTGLTNGQTYSYSVFTIDGAGNASAPESVAATPGAVTQPPPPVTNVRRTDTR